MDICALEIMQRTGNWTYVEPLFPYMTSSGKENVVTLHNQKIGYGNKTSNVDENMNKPKEVTNDESEQFINKTYEDLAYELFDKTKDLNSCIVIFEYMSKSDVEQFVNSIHS